MTTTLTTAAVGTTCLILSQLGGGNGNSEIMNVVSFQGEIYIEFIHSQLLELNLELFIVFMKCAEKKLLFSYTAVQMPFFLRLSQTTNHKPLTKTYLVRIVHCKSFC